MSNYSKLYWLTRLDNLTDLFQCIAFISGFAIAAMIIIRIVASDDIGPITSKKMFKWGRISGIVFFIFLCLYSFTPTKDEAIFIMAGGKTMDFVQSDTSINKIPAQTTKIITDFLQKEIEKTNKK